MSDNILSAAALTRRAIADANEGDIDDARTLLAEAIHAHPDYESAWLWLGYLARNDGERKFCFERASAINPESPATARLRDLQNVHPEPPPEVEDLVDPPPPPEFDDLLAAATGRLPRWAWIAASLVVAGAIVAAVAYWLTRDDEPGGDAVSIAVVAGSVDEPGSTGDQIVKGAQLYFDDLNARGGANGHPIEIVTFDDQDDPEIAVHVAREIVQDDRFLLVIGHRTSAASLAASPIYEEAGIPVISPTATAEGLTSDNPWYFRTIFTNSEQGAVIAAYLRQFMDVDRAAIVSSNESYGESLASGFREGFESLGGNIEREIVIDGSADDLESEITAAMTELSDDSNAEAVFLALPAEIALEVIVSIRDMGITVPVFGGDSIANAPFINDLTERSNETGDPKRYTIDLFAASPLLADSVSGELVYLRDEYVERFETVPTWRSAMAYDAAITAAFAISETGTREDVNNLRAGIRDALNSLDGPESSLRGLNGPIYFDEERTIPRSVGVATVQDGLLVSAPMQFQLWSESSGVPIEDTLEINGYHFTEQQVVYTGFAFNHVRDFDSSANSYFVDFLVWFTFVGDDDVVDVVMVNADQDEFTASSDMGLGEPIISIDNEDSSYRLYHVGAHFKSQFDYRDYPFDNQELPVTLSHRSFQSGRVVFVVDPEIRRLSSEELLQSAINAENSIDSIPNWIADEVTISTESVGTNSTLGIPDAAPGSTGAHYSQFTSSVALSRSWRPFLIKNILPLVLLAGVTYISLFIPHTQTGVRVSFGITGILTGAVLLSGVTDTLPNVDYNVAIEWAYFAFIALSAGTILVGILGDRLHDVRNLSALRKLDWISRIAYPTVVAIIVIWYWTRFA